MPNTDDLTLEKEQQWQNDQAESNKNRQRKYSTIVFLTQWHWYPGIMWHGSSALVTKLITYLTCIGNLSHTVLWGYKGFVLITDL